MAKDAGRTLIEAPNSASHGKSLQEFHFKAQISSIGMTLKTLSFFDLYDFVKKIANATSLTLIVA